MTRKLPIAEIVLALAVLAAGAAVYVYAHRDEAEIEQTKAAGDVLVAALAEYRGEHGAYPSSLQALVPQQLAAVPPTSWGNGWSYRAFDDGEHCELYVRAESGLTLWYDFTADRWALERL